MIDHINKRNGVASLIQISSKSTMEMEHMYLYEKKVEDGSNNKKVEDGSNEINPFFRNTYKQHTNFDRVPMIQEYNDVFTNSKIIHIFDILETDMVGNFFLKIHIPEICEDLVWVNDIGHAIIKYIRILNADEEVAYFTGEYLNISYKLDTKQSKLRGVDEMISHHSSRFSLSNKSRILYVDIPFLKNGEEYQYFPLLNSKKNSFNIHIQFSSIQDLVQTNPTKHGTEYVHCVLTQPSKNIKINLSTVFSIESINEKPIKIGFCYDAVKLCDEERNIFLTKKSNILFKQIQYKQIDLNSPAYEEKIQLDFRHNLSEIIIVLSLNTIDNEPFVYRPLKNIVININGIDLNNNILSNRYMNRHHSIPKYYIYVVPFCLDNMTNQPTGTFSFDDNQSINQRFSPLDHNKLFMGLKTTKFDNGTGGIYKKNELRIIRSPNYINENCVLKVFAKSFNVLRIENKSVSLQYL